MLICALGFAGCVASADDQTGAVEQHTGGSSGCQNNSVISGVTCVQSISILNGLTVNIKDVNALDNNKLSVLSGDLNGLSILDGDILDYNTILNDVEVTVLNDFLNKFNINTTVSKIDVCALVGILQVCK
jgi:hypothetical protein